MAPRKIAADQPIRKDVKMKFSPSKKGTIKFNHAYVTGFKFGLLSLMLKKATHMMEDAYFKDFIDILEGEQSIAEKLGIIKIVSVRDTPQNNKAKTQTNGYRVKQIIGLAPIDKENDLEFRKLWAEKIIDFLNNEVKWKYENSFRFCADLSKITNGKLEASLDECLLDEDIGGFVGAFLFDDVELVKGNAEIMKNIFGQTDNYQNGETTLLSYWNNWKEE